MTTFGSPAPTRSQIFSVYNRARAAARRGLLDAKRVDRALGLLLRRDGSRPYRTNVRACTCPDSRRGSICKHRIAAMMRVRIAQAGMTGGNYANSSRTNV